MNHLENSSDDSTSCKEDNVFLDPSIVDDGGVVMMDIDPPSQFEDTAVPVAPTVEDKREEWQQMLDRMYESKNTGYIHQLSTEISNEMSKLSTVMEEKVLDVSELYSVYNMKESYKNVLNQVEMTQNLEKRRDLKSLVTIDWIDQPLSRSFKNKNRAKRKEGKKVKGNCVMVAKTFCAPGVTFTPTSAVTAQFYCTAADALPTRSKRVVSGEEKLMDFVIENNVEKMSPNGEVMFDFRFRSGTRNKPCSIKLRCKGIVTCLDGRKEEVELVSKPTNKFIIITNESQFEVAELRLLRGDVFGTGQGQCAFAKFVNQLNIRWMRVTRQESDRGIAVNVTRPLSEDDIEYFCQSFFPDAPYTVTEEQLSKFYSFFGKVTHLFRHNAAVRDYLLEGCIYGFLSKARTSVILNKFGDGSFLIRASETTPGAFCLSFLDQGKVRHSVIDSKILTSGCKSQLADFLLARPFLKNLVLPAQHGTANRIKEAQEAFGDFSSGNYHYQSKKNLVEEL